MTSCILSAVTAWLCAISSYHTRHRAGKETGRETRGVHPGSSATAPAARAACRGWLFHVFTMHDI